MGDPWQQASQSSFISAADTDSELWRSAWGGQAQTAAPATGTIPQPPVPSSYSSTAQPAALMPAPIFLNSNNYGQPSTGRPGPSAVSAPPGTSVPLQTLNSSVASSSSSLAVAPAARPPPMESSNSQTALLADTSVPSSPNLGASSQQFQQPQQPGLPSSVGAPPPPVQSATAASIPTRTVRPLPLSRLPKPPIIAAALSIAMGGLAPTMAHFLGLLLDLFAKYSLGHLPPLPFSQQTIHNVIIICALGGAAGIFAAVSKGLWERWAEGHEKIVRQGVFKALLAAGSGAGWDGGEAEWKAGMARDPPIFRNALMQYPELLMLTGTCIAALVVALINSWSLALVLLALVPLHYILLLLLSRAAAGSAKAGLEATAASSRHATDVFTHLQDVFAFDGQTQVSARFESLLRAAQALAERTAHLNAFSRSLFGFLLLSVFSLGAWYAGTVVIKGATAGRVLACFLCAVLGASAAQAFRARWADLNHGRRAIAAAYRALETASGGVFGGDMGGFLPAPSTTGGRTVVLDRVTIPARGKAEGLSDLSLTLSPGSTTAFSCAPAEFAALAELLLRLRDPQSGGRAEIDGVPLIEYDSPFIRRNMIAVAGVAYPLLSGSIAEAVTDGRQGGLPAPVVAELWAVLERVGMAAIVKGLPRQLETNVWVLSEGERQRLGVARALYKRPEILILDDPAPELPESDETDLIRAVLAGDGIRKPTVLLRTPRQDIFKLCSSVAVFSHGHLVETGRYSALLSDPISHLAHALSRPTTPIVGEPSVPALRRTGRLDGTSGHAKKESNGSSSSDYASLAEQMMADLEDPTKKIADTNDESLLPGFEPMLPKGPTDEELALAHLRPAPTFTTEDVFKLSEPETGLLTLGSFAAVARGMVVPLFAVVLAKLLFVYTAPQAEDVRAGANFWCLLVFTLAAFEGLVFYLKVFAFELSGERLTLRVRKRTFDAAIGHELAWFDAPEHGPGVVLKGLAIDSARVRGATTSAWGNLLGYASTVIGGFVWTMVLGWKLGLIAWAAVPAAFLASRLEAWARGRYAAESKAAYARADAVAGESIQSWRTVAAHGLEEKQYGRYVQALLATESAAEKGRVFTSIAYGVSQCVLFLSQALFWWFAMTVLKPFQYDLTQILMIWSLAAFCGAVAGQAGHLRGAFEASRIALANIALLMAPGPVHEPGRRYMGDATPQRGALDIANLAFTDTDTGLEILKGIGITAAAGEHIAVMGCSRDEREAILSLILALYQPSYGRIVVDGVDVRDWDAKYLRSKVVSLWDRNAPLFSGTAAENVAFGMPDATPEQIVRAGEEAGLAEEVRSWSRQWETLLGAGGRDVDDETVEKIALARALIRQPGLLLVDDPPPHTSSAAMARLLDSASYNRTVLRLTDDIPSAMGCRIVMVQDGKVVETGTHSELLERHGYYYARWNAQN